MDLEENLREKDELIRARTAAVTLMSADLSAKGKTTLDQVNNDSLLKVQEKCSFNFEVAIVEKLLVKQSAVLCDF